LLIAIVPSERPRQRADDVEIDRSIRSAGCGQCLGLPDPARGLHGELLLARGKKDCGLERAQGGHRWLIAGEPEGVVGRERLLKTAVAAAGEERVGFGELPRLLAACRATRDCKSSREEDQAESPHAT